MIRVRISLLLLLMTALFGCRTEQSSNTLPTIQMKLGQKTFTLEVASTAASRERGLMRRDSMPADHGMIFVFDRDIPLSFYMKNTRIPLDIIFINGDGRVVSVKQMKAYDLTTTSSDAPAKWAVELNAGAAENAGVAVGDGVVIPERARVGEP
jgi:uncharacterized membrane protein (UPF0127 family)